MATQRHSVLPGYYSALPKSKTTQSKTYTKPSTSSRKYYPTNSTVPPFTGYNGYYLPTAQDGGWGDWLKLGVQLIDQTGISSWGDAYRSIKNFAQHPSWGAAGDMLLDVVSAVPGASVLGKVGKVISKAEKAVKAADKAHDAVIATSKVANAFNKSKKAVKGATGAVNRYVIKPTLKTAEVLTTGVPVLKRVDKVIGKGTGAIANKARRVITKATPKVDRAIGKVENYLITHPKVARTMDYINKTNRWQKGVVNPTLNYIFRPDPGQQANKVGDYNPNVQAAGNPEVERLVDSTLEANPDLMITPDDVQTVDPMLQQIQQSENPDEFRVDELDDETGLPLEELPPVQRYGGSLRGLRRYQYGGAQEEMYYPEEDDENYPESPYPGAVFDRTPNMVMSDRTPDVLNRTPDILNYTGDPSAYNNTTNFFVPNFSNPFATQASPVAQVPVAAAKPSTFDLQPYEGSSIVDFLAKQGVPYDYSSRIQLAKLLGIPNYRGTASQNLQILATLKANPNFISSYAQIAPAMNAARLLGGGKRTAGAGAPTVAKPTEEEAKQASPTETLTPKPQNKKATAKAAKGDKPGYYISLDGTDKTVSGPYTADQINRMILTGKINYMNTKVINWTNPKNKWSLVKDSKDFQNATITKLSSDFKSSGDPLIALMSKQSGNQYLDKFKNREILELDAEEIKPQGGGPRRTAPVSRQIGNAQRRIANPPKTLSASTTRAPKTLPSSPSRTAIPNTANAKSLEANKVIRRMVAKGSWDRADIVRLKELDIKQESIDRIIKRLPRTPIQIPSSAASAASEASEIVNQASKASKVYNTVRRLMGLTRLEEGGDYSGTWSGNTYYDMGGNFPYGGVVDPYEYASMIGGGLPQYQMGSYYDDYMTEDETGEDEMYVTPEEMEILRQQGYDFDVIG